jgi:TonB family protein
MGMQPRRHLRGRIGRGILLSLFLHGQILVPLLTWLFWWGNFDDGEVGVTFENVKDDELPPDLPSVDKPLEPSKVSALAAKPAKPTPEAAPKMPPEAEEKKAEQPAEPERDKIAEAEKKPEPPKAEDKPKVEEADLLHQKIVDLDMGKEVEAPENAKYLAQRNNRTDRETRAKHTNLDMAERGKATEGGDEEEKIAHLQEHEAKAGRRGDQPISDGQEVAPGPRTPLSMRMPGVPRVGERGEALPESPDGYLAQKRLGQPGRKGGADSPPVEDRSPHLTRKGYASTFGDDAAAAAAFAKQERSKHKGKFTAHAEKVWAALENFISEVTPDNQTELNTRASPFAQFITRMHRQIHEKWAFGFLESLNLQLKNTPFDDMSLMANLEIVLDKTGNVDKISMVRASGNTGFDAAAVSSVYAAVPFPTPPEAILSGNGKVYLHWKFHRNGDACGTPGVSYFILDNGDGASSKRKSAKMTLPPRPHG